MLSHHVNSTHTTTAHLLPVIRSLLCRRYLLIFVLLTAIALLYNSNQPANAQISFSNSTNPNGTIPPGGTLPPPAPDPTQGQVRVLHLAPIAADLGATEVDLCTEGGNPVTGLTGLVYLGNSGYVTLPPGLYDWFVGTPGCTTALLDLPPFLLGPGSVLTLLIVGGANGQPFSSISVVDVLGRIYQLYLPLVYIP